VRNRFLCSTFLKQLEHILKKEWYKIPLEIIQNLYASIARRIVAVLKAKGDTVSLVFHYFGKPVQISENQ
jgi:hypothetical protein